MGRITLDNYEAFVLDYIEGQLDASAIQELKEFVLLHPELDIDLGEAVDLPVLNKDAVFYSEREELKRDYSSEQSEILHYMEGLFSDEEKVAFEKRLSADSRLLAELDLYRKTTMPADPEVIANFKNKLKHDEDEFLLNNSILRYLEGEMNPGEATEFLSQIKSQSGLNNDLELYRKAHLEPELTLLYPDKEELKKGAMVLPLWRQPLYFRAAAGLLILLFLSLFVVYFLPESSDKKPSLAKHNEKPSFRAPKQKTETHQNPVAIAESGTEKFVQKTKAVKSLATVTSNSAVIAAQENTKIDSSALAEEQNKLVTSKSIELFAQNEAQDSKTLEQLETIYMIPFEEDDSDEPETNEIKTKKGFWPAAARLAQRINKLGLKSVNGKEMDGERYLLSFNAMSVEKK